MSRSTITVAAILAAALLNEPVAAQEPEGSEFTVNSFTTGSQFRPRVDSLPDGFAILFRDTQRPGAGSGEEYVQILDRDGNQIGSDFRVNSGPVPSGMGFSDRGEGMGTDGDGNLVVVWSELDATFTGTVQARRFDSLGVPIGSEFQVTSNTTQAVGASVAVSANGSFTVKWIEDGLRARVFDGSGSPVGSEFLVANADDGYGFASDGAGNFLIAWSGFDDGDSSGIGAQLFDSAGNPKGPAFQVNSYTTGYQGPVTAAMSDDGSFVISWTDLRASARVYAQPFTSDGTKVGTEFEVSSQAGSGFQYENRVEMGPNGDFVVVWENTSYGPGYERINSISGRHFASDGTPIGDTFVANSSVETFTGRGFSPDVAISGDRFVVTWWEYGVVSDNDIRAQVYRSLPCEFAIDADGDLIGDLCDVCVVDFNPDQLNSDCSDPSFVLQGGCASDVPSSKAGCCDGGDLCDVCPATDDNTRCDPSRTVAGNIGSAGGLLTTPDGQVTISVPPGALGDDTSVSLTDNGPRTKFTLARGSQTVFSVSARPEGQHFSAPVTISFQWNDVDNDGIVDGTTRPENKLSLKKNLQRFSKGGFGVASFLCEDHLAGSGCESATAFCGDPEGTLKSTVAGCCDPAANTWSFQTCDFSEYVLALQEDDLIPSTGSPKRNCVTEWAVDNPFNVPFVDKKEFPNFKQTCTEGDPTCDKGRAGDGKCSFDVSVCLNVNDSRLLDREGNVACTPTDVAVWKLKKPRPDSKKPEEVLNAIALRDAVIGLVAPPSTATIGGKHLEELAFSPPVTQADICTAPIRIDVPLKGKNQDKKGKAVVKMQSVTTPPAGKSRGIKDSDKIKLTCLPPVLP